MTLRSNTFYILLVNRRDNREADQKECTSRAHVRAYPLIWEYRLVLVKTASGEHYAWSRVYSRVDRRASLRKETANGNWDLVSHPIYYTQPRVLLQSSQCSGKCVEVLWVYLLRERSPSTPGQQLSERSVVTS